MKSIINKISRALQVVLLAPIKLPGKALNILKYVAVGLGVIESVLENGKAESETQTQKEKEQDSDVAASTGGAHPPAEVNLDDDASVVPDQAAHFAQSDIVRPNTAAETEGRDE
ncbi:hypothetical protein FAZ19_21720 [Sphingobacterium alkalisoli]|uniref:Uncharacterized protein n=1 Tax=Sphingobacterium alkalisoli TaxID=1874115 RepID=A0A4U0GRP2_9SPHI|nr:hypothetical protein [Sphingobacterium alkalisoli]TJY61517.1 hypothetical protein FAZ19_21720 [Sphingobacterium alkalisoli]GGH29894.1 hypothetical protein GCM10011418_41540 [Sphingobacterium alkalisoli]